MSEMESKAALWHKKKEFRAIWGNPGSLQPLGRNNMSQLLLYTLSRVLANCPQLYCPASVLILAKKRGCRIAGEINEKDAFSSSACSTCPL